jgi:hypothetical protein
MRVYSVWVFLCGHFFVAVSVSVCVHTLFVQVYVHKLVPALPFWYLATLLLLLLLLLVRCCLALCGLVLPILLRTRVPTWGLPQRRLRRLRRLRWLW